MDLSHQLNWRYVIKRNGPRITEEKLDSIIHTIRSSATAFGLLPHTILLVRDRDQLQQISSLTDHQQVKKATHLIVFTAWTSIHKDNINEIIAHIAALNGLSLNNSSDYKTIMKLLVKIPDEVKLEWCTKQAYIALGVGLMAAAKEQVDATPVEEFKNKELDRLLNIDHNGLSSVAMLALGQRDESGGKARTAVIKPKKEKVLPFMIVN